MVAYISHARNSAQLGGRKRIFCDRLYIPDERVWRGQAKQARSEVRNSGHNLSLWLSILQKTFCISIKNYISSRYLHKKYKIGVYDSSKEQGKNHQSVNKSLECSMSTKKTAVNCPEGMDRRQKRINSVRHVKSPAAPEGWIRRVQFCNVNHKWRIHPSWLLQLLMMDGSMRKAGRRKSLRRREASKRKRVDTVSASSAASSSLAITASVSFLTSRTVEAWTQLTT